MRRPRRNNAKLIIATGARPTPIIEISPPRKNPPLETPKTGMHWTGLQDRNTDQIGKKCPKNVKKYVHGGLGQFSNNFRTLFGHFRHFVIILFFRDAETTILIKFAFWRGSGRGKI